MVVARVLNQTIRSTRLIVLAAIISPEQLGLFGLAMVAMMLIQQLGETGIRRALIQRDGNIREFLATAQTVQIARGLLLASTIFFLSPQAETFFEKEGLAQLLMVLAVVPFIGGFKNIGEVYLYRELRMKKVVALQLILTIVEFATALIFCLLSPVAISLIYAQIVSAMIGLAGSYVIEKRRTFWGFSRQRFLHLYSFGFWVFISAVISFLLVRGGDLVIGKLLPAADLAVYQIAYGVACMPIIEISRVLSTTTFSAFSRLQSEDRKSVV